MGVIVFEETLPSTSASMRVARSFFPERRYHQQSTLRHIPEDRKRRTKLFYLFESKTKNDIVWDSKDSLNRGELTVKLLTALPPTTTHFLSRAAHLPGQQQKFKACWNVLTCCIRSQNAVIHYYQETPVTMPQIDQEPR